MLISPRGSLKEALLGRVLRRRLVRVPAETEVLRTVLRRRAVIEGAWEKLGREKHALSQSTTPLCVLSRGRQTLVEGV